VKLSPPVLVQTSSAWQNCLAQLRQQKRLAIDTESNGLYAYREQVCLIQISIHCATLTDQRFPVKDYLIDPLRLSNLEGLGELMADSAVEKIFHAAEYDILCLKRDFGYSFANIYDTMLAARTLGWKKLGLGSLLSQEFSIKLDKRFQRANWGRRPLSDELIAYARLDTHYLFALRDRLAEELETSERAIEARENFDRLVQVEPTPHCFNPDDFWHLLNGRRQLSPQQNAVLRELYIFRNREAQRRDYPQFKVFANRTLIELAEALPHFLDELQGIHGMTSRQIHRYGRKLIRVIEQGLQAPPPGPPPPRVRPPETVLARFDALHSWRKRRAQHRGVESDIIVCKDALWDLANQDPKCATDLETIKSMGEWQREHYGHELLQVLSLLRKRK